MTPRARFLAVKSVMNIIVGSSFVFIDPAQRAGLDRVYRLATFHGHVALWWYGAAWLASGAAALAVAFDRRGGDDVGFAVVLIPWVLFTLFHLAAWRAGDEPRGWVAATFFAAVASAILIVAGMPDPPNHVPPTPHRWRWHK